MAVWAFASIANAATIYVKADASGANTGKSWTNAYKSLQSALAAAAAGDEIWVSAGIYKPTAGADRTVSFAMKNGVAIYGGFAGNETSHNRNYIAHRSILSGEIGASTTTLDNSYHVVTGANGRLDGFTITAGYADRKNHLNGGGMRNIRVSPAVANCVFVNNTVAAIAVEENQSGADSMGGAVYNGSASPQFVNCVFAQNSVTGSRDCAMGMGGAIYADTSSTLKLTNCIFHKNTATGGSGSIGAGPYVPASDGVACGGAIYARCKVTLMNCTFFDNSVTGGWIEPYTYQGMYYVGHSAWAMGDELYLYRDLETAPTSMAVNCIVKASGIYLYNAKIRHVNCDVEGSRASGGSWDRSAGTDGGGNIDADPRFINPAAPAGGGRDLVHGRRRPEPERGFSLHRCRNHHGCAQPGYYGPGSLSPCRYRRLREPLAQRGGAVGAVSVSEILQMRVSGIGKLTIHVSWKLFVTRKGK